MADRKLMCEVADCGQLAKVFEMKGTKKVNVCKEHSTLVLERSMPILETTEYDSISNRQDADDYEERKKQADKGLRNWKALTKQLEEELDEAYQAIEEEKRKVIPTVESRFEEIKHAVEKVHTQVTAELKELQENVEQFLQLKENQLSSTAKLMCMDFTATRKLLRFGINDASGRISAELNSSWEAASIDLYKAFSCLSAPQTNIAIGGAPEEAKNYTNKETLTVPQNADSSTESSFDQELQNFLKQEKRLIEQSSECPQTGSRQQDEAMMEVETQIKKLVYCQQGKFLEAEQILQDFLCNSALLRRPPADSITLCNDILEVSFARAEYKKIESLGLSVLQTYQAANLSAELYWTTLLYVTYSMRQLGKDREASDTFEVWKNRIGQGDTKLARMLLLLTSGIDASFSDNQSEVKEGLLQALRIGTSHYPTSTFTALACFRLTFVCEENAREQHHLLTKSLYEVISPKCAHAAVNLTNMGVFLFNKQRPDEAEEKITQAQSILEIAAPESVHAGKNLTNLGVLQYMKGQWRKAEMYMKKAESILNNAAPNSVDAAINYFYMGMLYEENSRKKEAIERYSKAAILYEKNGNEKKQSDIKEKITHLEKQRRCWP